MSGTAAAAAATLAWAPWTDKKGRLHPLRATVFGLLLLPGLWLAIRYAAGMLGARPLNELIHGAGFWTAWILLASLTVTPARAVLGLPTLPVVRRMVGNAALIYGVIHLLLYVIDQKWALLHVAAEIALRFYLTIGFVALVGLGVLGATSTDGWARKLGPRWKRLHRLVYGLTVLGVVHYFLQSKADVSLPLLAAGVFFWLMLWRLLPAGRDRGPLALLGLAAASAILTLVAEYLWYRFGTRIDPMRVLRSELDVTFGLRPAGQVLALGLLAAAAVQLRTLGQGRAGQFALFTVGIFALGAWVAEGASFIFGLETDDGPEGVAWWGWTLAGMAGLGGLGGVRWMVRDSRQRRIADALGAGFVVYQVVLAANGARSVEIALAAALAVTWGILAWQTWQVSRPAALLLAPAGVLLSYGVAGLL